MPDVNVAVTLKSGQTFNGVLDSQDRLLADLHVALASQHDPAASNSPTIIQFPSNSGQSSCTFMSNSIDSVVTSPPVLLQPAQADQALPGNIDLAPQAPSFMEIEDFLTIAENRELLKYTLDNEAQFEGSTVHVDKKKSSDKERRKSRVLFGAKDSKWKDIFINRLKLHLPHLCARMGLSQEGLINTEFQITASNDGDFFSVHSDSDANHPDLSLRTITFVYYYHKTPRPYSGGKLLVYPGHPNDGQNFGTQVQTVEPRNNCLVVFASDTWHEIDMVSCPSGDFADSRFTINGWMRRGEQQSAKSSGN